MSRITNIEDFRGWLSLVEPTNMDDNQFEVLNNMFYNKDKRIQTRKGITTFWNAIWSDPITSSFFFQNDITWVRMLLCTAWTVMYKYNEWTSNWDSIKTWLTAFEADWTTRTRWSFAVYLNVVYMCNWIDAYADYDWTTYTTHWAQPKPRYLRYMADSIYWAWVDAAPSTIYATTAWAVNAETLNANDLVVWWDELWRINWIRDLWNLILVFKNKKIYSVQWDLASSEAIDSQNWWFSHRAIANVENSLMYYNDAWVDTMKARNWVTWAAALATESKSSDLRALLDLITPAQYNNNCGTYINPINNYYFTFDTWNDSVPNETLVYSSLVWSWSSYNLPALYDYSFYIDTDWVYHYLISSANWWQMYEIETWVQDLGLWIASELKTKVWDFWDVWLWKTFDTVDIQWFKNEWSDINVEILIDWEIASNTIITDDFISSTITAGTSSPVWTTTIWTTSIWWWLSSQPWDEIDLYPYLIRIPMYTSWPNIQIRMYSEDNPNIWTLDKIKISRDDESMDIFPTLNIA